MTYQFCYWYGPYNTRGAILFYTKPGLDLDAFINVLHYLYIVGDDDEKFIYLIVQR